MVLAMKKVLHVGSGGVHIINTHGFNQGEWEEVRLDINPAMGPDIVGSMTDMQGVPDKSFDAVYSSHNIEHLYPHEVPIALKEFRRVLKDDGFCLIITPDIQAVALRVAQGNLTGALYQSSAGPIAALDIMYGHRPSLERGNLFMAHHTAFTNLTLQEALMKANFADIITDCEMYTLAAIAGNRLTDFAVMALETVFK